MSARLDGRRELCLRLLRPAMNANRTVAQSAARAQER
jgi:hypothetical protein